MPNPILVGIIPPSHNNAEIIPIYYFPKKNLLGSLKKKKYRVELLKPDGRYHGYLTISDTGMWWGTTYPLQQIYSPDQRLEILEELGLVYIDEM